jgi:hypothetical protein
MTGNYALLLVAQQMAELARNSKCGLSRQTAGMSFLQHTRLCMFNPVLILQQSFCPYVLEGVT